MTLLTYLASKILLVSDLLLSNPGDDTHPFSSTSPLLACLAGDPNRRDLSRRSHPPSPRRVSGPETACGRCARRPRRGGVPCSDLAAAAMLGPPVPVAAMANPYAAPYTAMVVPIAGDFSCFGQGGEGYGGRSTGGGGGEPGGFELPLRWERRQEREGRTPPSRLDGGGPVPSTRSHRRGQDVPHPICSFHEANFPGMHSLILAGSSPTKCSVKCQYMH